MAKSINGNKNWSDDGLDKVPGIADIDRIALERVGRLQGVITTLGSVWVANVAQQLGQGATNGTVARLNR